MNNYFGKETMLIVNLSVFIVTLNCFCANLGVYDYRSSPPLLISSLILTFFAIFLYKKEQSLGNISKYVLITLVIIGAFYGIAGVIFSIPTYVMNGYIFVLQLPLLYICMKKDILIKIIPLYCKAFVFLSSIMLFLFFISAPLTNGQYQGNFNNPNLTGEYLTSVIVCALYLYTVSTQRKYKVAYLALFGISLVLIIFTRSRTSILACAFVLVAFFIYALRDKKRFFKSLLCLFIATAVALPSVFFTLSNITPLLSDVTGLNGELFIRTDDSEGTFDDNRIDDNSDKTHSLKEELGASSDRLLKGINNDSSFSSGRAQIWYSYIKNISLKPHRPELVIFYYDGQELKANAHNSFLHVAYQSGLLPGIVYFIMYTATGVVALIALFKKKTVVENLFSIMVLANSVPYVVLSNTFGPYTSFSLLPFWIISIPYFLNSKDNFK